MHSSCLSWWRRDCCSSYKQSKEVRGWVKEAGEVRSLRVDWWRYIRTLARCTGHTAQTQPLLQLSKHENCAYLPTYIHTYIHTYIYTYLHTYIHTYIHIYIPTYIHTYIHTYVYSTCMAETYIIRMLQYLISSVHVVGQYTHFYKSSLHVNWTSHPSTLSPFNHALIASPQPNHPHTLTPYLTSTQPPTHPHTLPHLVWPARGWV